MNLLGKSNTKTIKGQQFGWSTAIMSLLPSDEAIILLKKMGKSIVGILNACVNASKGCRLGCLNKSGRAGLSSVQLARLNKTVFFWRERQSFMAKLVLETARHERFCKKRDLGCAVRLNGTSDIIWESPEIGFPFDQFPGVQMYDYTKHPLRLRQKALEIPNYDLTYSWSDHPMALERSLEYIESGLNVAIVFRKEIPPTFTFHISPGKTLTCSVVNGEESDLRFLDRKAAGHSGKEQGLVVGLLAKGKAKTDQTGFVLDSDWYRSPEYWKEDS